MELTEAQKILILEEAALFRTPEEISEIYKKLGKVKFTGRALGFACHYRGLDIVKALVKCGADFSRDFVFEVDRLDPLDKELLLVIGNSTLNEDFSIALFAHAPSLYNTGFYNFGRNANLEPVSFTERMKILEYFWENAEKVKFDKTLFIQRVAEYGPEFASYFREPISGMLAEIVMSDQFSKWYKFYLTIDGLPDEEFIPCLTEVISKLGGMKLDYSESVCLEVMEHRFKIPGMYKFFFENFEPSEENKAVTAEYIIMSETPDIFDIAEQYGWFDDLEFINKMIGSSSGIKKIEFTAWLLDCKNRHFDIAAEREAEDKKLALD